jgi:hypothetical protein
MLQRYITCSVMEVFGQAVGELLEVYFKVNERVRGYILDDQGRLSPNLAIFVDGVKLEDVYGLSYPIHLLASVYVLHQPLVCQAVSFFDDG